jgi:class 3 adenylate cyclase/DNA-binding transcriptional MerR regulator
MNERRPPSSLSVDELATAVGTDAETVRIWHRLGLVSGDDSERFPFEEIERARLITYAERRGIGAAEIADACRTQGDVVGQFVALITGGIPRWGHSPDEVAHAAGLDRDAFRRFWVASGLGDQDEAYDEDIQSLGWLAIVRDSGLPEEALIQLVRVFADAIGRVAEAESRVFHYYVHERLRADGLDGEALTAATTAYSEPLVGLAEPALIYFHRKAFQRALREDFLLHLTEAVATPGATAGEMTATILFVDLSGFTPLAEAMGDRVAADIVERFSHLVRDALTHHAGNIVKQIGDEFMLTFPNPTDAVAYGIEIADILAAEEHFPKARIGAHHGPLLYREGDYIGTTVNIAARVAAVAERNQFLITNSLRAAARMPDDTEVVTLGPRALKGISGEVVLHVVRHAQPRPDRVVDPVCHMALAPESAAVAASWRDIEYYFCSADCAERFFADPDKALAT